MKLLKKDKVGAEKGTRAQKTAWFDEMERQNRTGTILKFFAEQRSD